MPDETTPSDRIKQLCKPQKIILKDLKSQTMISNPEHPVGHLKLREKFSIPFPNQLKYGRPHGGISSSELEKLSIGTVRPNRVIKSKRILPRSIRDDPSAIPPPISEHDINDGMFNLLNRGIIPRDVDVSPAFERGIPALTS